jgi:hypothetical protein
MRHKSLCARTQLDGVKGVKKLRKVLRHYEKRWATALAARSGSWTPRPLALHCGQELDENGAPGFGWSAQNAGDVTVGDVWEHLNRPADGVLRLYYSFGRKTMSAASLARAREAAAARRGAERARIERAKRMAAEALRAAEAETRRADEARRAARGAARAAAGASARAEAEAEAARRGAAEAAELAAQALGYEAFLVGDCRDGSWLDPDGGGTLLGFPGGSGTMDGFGGGTLMGDPDTLMGDAGPDDGGERGGGTLMGDAGAEGGGSLFGEAACPGGLLARRGSLFQGALEADRRARRSGAPPPAEAATRKGIPKFAGGALSLRAGGARDPVVSCAPRREGAGADGLLAAPNAVAQFRQLIEAAPAEEGGALSDIRNSARPLGVRKRARPDDGCAGVGSGVGSGGAGGGRKPGGGRKRRRLSVEFLGAVGSVSAAPGLRPDPASGASAGARAEGASA